MRLLTRLGDHVPRREIEVLTVVLDRLLREARHEHAHRLLPDVALVPHASAEGMELDRTLALAQPELDATAGEQVQGGHPLGDPDRVVGGKLDDAVAETDAPGTLGGRAQEDLGRRGVRVLLEEVVFHLPRVVVAEPVGQLDLGQRILEQAILAVRPPGPRQLMLVEDAELHAAPSTPPGPRPPAGPEASGIRPRSMTGRPLTNDHSMPVAHWTSRGPPPGRSWISSGS